VNRTLDISPYRERPCDLLTGVQQNALSLPRTVDRTDLCSWERAQPKDSVTVQLLIDLSYLNQVYLESNKEKSSSGDKEWVTFEPVTIKGQPAVVLNPTTNPTYSSVLVGASTKDSFYVSVTSEITTTDLRAKAIVIADQIVGNLAR